MAKYPRTPEELVEWFRKRGLSATERRCKFCGGLAVMGPKQYYCSQSCDYQAKHPVKPPAEEHESEIDLLRDQVYRLECAKVPDDPHDPEPVYDPAVENAALQEYCTKLIKENGELKQEVKNLRKLLGA